MKSSLLFAWAALFAPAAVSMAADEPPAAVASTKPELRGILVTTTGRRFLLSSPGGTVSKWVAVGESFDSWKVDAFDGKQSTLTLKGNAGQELTLSMEAGKTGEEAAQPADLAQVQRMMEKIHFGEMLKKVLDGQRAAQLAAIRQSLEKRGMPQDQIDAIVAKQTQMLNRMWANVDMQDVQKSMAQIYSEEFTADQLEGISEFYDTPAGQATLAKAPEIQSKIMQAIMPKLIAAQQQMAAEQKAKAAAAPAPAATPKS
jgi:hypothetical protein